MYILCNELTLKAYYRVLFQVPYYHFHLSNDEVYLHNYISHLHMYTYILTNRSNMHCIFKTIIYSRLINLKGCDADHHLCHIMHSCNPANVLRVTTKID